MFAAMEGRVKYQNCLGVNWGYYKNVTLLLLTALDVVEKGILGDIKKYLEFVPS